MNKYLPVVIVVVIIGAIGYYLTTMNKAVAPETTKVVPSEALTAEEGSTPSEAVKEFTVTGSNFSFDPKTITVKKGDRVKVTFKNKDGFHDFVIDEFNVATKQIQGGQQEVVEFVADQAGSFEYYCSVGQHRANGMFGSLVVEE